MQAHNGGFYTGYLPNGVIPQGVTTNTETTSLVIYAYSPKIIEYYFGRKELPFTFSIWLIFSIGVLIAAIGMVVYIIKRIIKKLNRVCKPMLSSTKSKAESSTNLLEDKA